MPTLLQLFWTFLKINAVTFGGGYTITAVLRDEFVQREGIITEEDMLDLTALAQSGPGAMAMNICVLTGYKLRGIRGALVGIISAALPSLVTITIVSYFYNAFRENFFVKGALRGMAGMITGVLFVTTYRMAKNVLMFKPIFSGLIMAGVLLVSYFLKINAALIIVVMGIFGLILFSLIDEDDLK